MRAGWIGLAAAVAFSAGAGWAQDDEPPSLTRDFGDWNVACDNVRGCTAIGFAADEAGGAGPHVFIRRGGAAADWPRVELGVGWTEEAQALKNGDRLEVAVDGPRAMRFTATIRKGANDYDAPVPQFPAEKTDAFMAALVQGERITLSLNGQTLGAISLKGSSAALRWIDAQQRRDGGVTALVARGAKPASAVPAASVEPTYTRAAAISQAGVPRTVPPALAAREDVKLCAEEYDEENPMRPDVSRLSKTEYLWHIPCGAGAYNFNGLFLIARRDGTGARSPGFGYPEPDHLVNGTYDPKTRMLTAFAKGRGLGDCGDDAAWVWDGRAFRPTHRAVMETCLGVTSEHWHVIWRAKVR